MKQKCILGSLMCHFCSKSFFKGNMILAKVHGAQEPAANNSKPYDSTVSYH